MRIFIRHGHKEYANTIASKYGLDCGVDNFGGWAATIQFESLLKTCLPNVLVTSPFYRARQTANVAQLVIRELTGIIVPIYVDSKLGEFLIQDKYSPKIVHDRELLRPATLIHKPIFPETKRQHRSRMESLLRSTAESMNFTVNYLVTLNTTHQTKTDNVKPGQFFGSLIQNASNYSESFVNDTFQPTVCPSTACQSGYPSTAYQPTVYPSTACQSGYSHTTYSPTVHPSTTHPVTVTDGWSTQNTDDHAVRAPELFAMRTLAADTIKPNDNVWYITHGLNIWWLSRMLGLGKYYPNELCGLILQANGRAARLSHALD